MNIFDLLFIVLFLAAVATLLSVAWSALRKDFGRVRRVYGDCHSVILVSLLLSRQVLSMGTRQCLDDWSITVEGLNRTFLIPSGVRILGVVITHHGGFPIGWFVIGYDTWLRKPTIVPLQ